MSRLTIDLPEEFVAWLTVESANRDVAPGAVIEEALRPLMPKAGAKSKISALELLRDIVGAVDSGVDDLATNPKYMEGFGRSRD